MVLKWVATNAVPMSREKRIATVLELDVIVVFALYLLTLKKLSSFCVRFDWIMNLCRLSVGVHDRCTIGWR